MSIDRSPILITGCARSGTSLIAATVHLCGAFGGELLGGSKFNAKGFFENRIIRDRVEKGYLKSIGVDPLGQYPLPDPDNIPIPNNWRKQVEDVMLAQGYQDPQPWFYKGAKACQIWPVWNYAFPNAKWIIVRRRSADIAQSCMNTSFMRAYNTYEGWIEWIHYHEARFVEMIQAGLNVKQIWPERLVRGNYEQAYEVIDWLGLKWNSKAVMDFIEPRLWKARKKAGINQ